MSIIETLEKGEKVTSISNSAQSPELQSHPLIVPISPNQDGQSFHHQDPPQDIPLPHRSHDPSNNYKRTDPFKFGSRFLQAEDDVYEFNAWDHVVPDDAYYAYAEDQYSNQRAAPVSEFDKKRFNSDPAKWWNKFYSNNTSKFFKDRKWLQQEFPILAELTTQGFGKATILEVGAGAGNTAFPILAANQNLELMVHACDFSSKAVNLINTNPAYDSDHLQASVWDISSDKLPPNVAEGSVDVVLLVFIFSALSPQQWGAAVRNIRQVLKPGGEVCFRDYGKGDLTQVRFKKGRLLEENFYIRGDGTRVYFFEVEELRRLWGGDTDVESIGATMVAREELVGKDKKLKNNGTAKGSDSQMADGDVMVQGQRVTDASSLVGRARFDIVSLGVDRRMLVNRQKQLKMYRCWLQGRFKKVVGNEN